ncbi:MAG: asparagine synthase (glutamine-hydrolyzing) [bacterium]|nr:asparagine synthase (glutamine-hydrolyzing) [bacterium]
MCGIIGINEKNEKLIYDAADGFKYRGPDASAFFSNDLVSFGHHRLAILDLDSRSVQPMSDIDENLWIVFNGEIYNFKEIRNKLNGKYEFRTNSDTEVLIYAYKEWGAGMHKHIQGMFAFAIYDKLNQKIFLMRDHAGIKPLYYYAKDGFFVFCSEIKGITKILRRKNIDVEIDDKSMDFYFVFGYIPSPFTLFKNIKKLQKSSYLEYDLTARAVAREKKYPVLYKKVDNKKEYIKLLEKKVLGHLIADVPVGVFFSGGTDSSIIASILHKYNIKLENFSIKIDYKTDDVKYFSKINNKLNIKSNVYDFDLKAFDSVYEEIMDKIDEPSYDNSIFPTYFVSKMASKKVKVVLSGEGGDEFFYGYPRSLILSKLNNKNDYSITLLDRLFFYTPSFKSKNFIFERLFVLFKKPVSYYLLHMSPVRDLAALKSWKIVKDECKKRNVKPLAMDQEFYLENDLLRKIDFATSYASIEGRVPLLDVDIIKNSVLFESEKLEGDILKSFLKKILSLYLPKNLVYRSKSGFGLNMVYFFKKSKFLSTDLKQAIAFLKSRKINIPKFKFNNINRMIEKYPHYCFALISLYKSIKNND